MLSISIRRILNASALSAATVFLTAVKPDYAAKEQAVQSEIATLK